MEVLSEWKKKLVKIVIYYIRYYRKCKGCFRPTEHGYCINTKGTKRDSRFRKTDKIRECFTEQAPEQEKAKH